jgi:hypothetical protein
LCFGREATSPECTGGIRPIAPDRVLLEGVRRYV